MSTSIPDNDYILIISIINKCVEYFCCSLIFIAFIVFLWSTDNFAHQIFMIWTDYEHKHCIHKSNEIGNNRKHVQITRSQYM